MPEPVISKPAQAAAPPPVAEPVKSAEPKPHLSQDTTTFSTYRGERGHPMVAEHYGVERFWNQPRGYEAEVNMIEGYLQRLVKEGMDDSRDAVVSKLKELEKLAGLEKTSRPSIKIPQLSALVEFLNKKEAIRKDAIFRA